MTRAQENFYLHQNESWLNNPKNAIPNEYSSWGSFMCLADASLNDQIALLENLNGNTNIEILVSTIYKKSMSRFENWDSGISDYTPILEELNILNEKLSTKNIISLAEYCAYCSKKGIKYPISFDKGEDLKNSSKIKLDIGPGRLSLPERSYYFSDNFKEQRDKFRLHLENVKKILLDNNVNISDNFVNNVINFETKLAYIKMTNAQSRKYDEYFSKVDILDFHNHLCEFNFTKSKLDNYGDDKIVKLSETDIENVKIFMDKMVSLLDYVNIMNNNYLKNYGHNSDIARELCVYDGDYLSRVYKIMFDADNDEIKSYFEYNIISALKSFCSKQLDDEFFDFYNRTLSGQQQQNTHKKRSVGMVNSLASEPMGQIYVKHHFSEECKKDIIDMIAKVLCTMNTSIEKSDWLTNDTKKKAILKLSKFIMKIGYPDKWTDYSNLNILESDSLYEICKKTHEFEYQTEFLDKINSDVDTTKWHMSPQTVNAYFNPLLNEIVFPAAIIQPPFYNKKIEDSIGIINSMAINNYDYNPLKPINYGGIVTIIAHEITHGYDDNGKKMDENGNLNNWWTEEDDMLFKQKVDLMAEQVDLYTYTDSTGKNYKLNSELTMGENLADLGGLSLALKAMKLDEELVENGNFKDGVLELFFRSYANSWRLNIKEAKKIELLTRDPHAPVDFRANLVKNIDEFYETFNVTENDGMYISPQKRVRMW